MRNVAVLGSTGSVGTQALEVMAAAPDRFRVVALAAGGSDIPTLARQVIDTSPDVVALARASAVQDLQLALYAEARRRGWASGRMRLPRLLAGPDAVAEVARCGADVVLNAITGAAGLRATLATLAAGSTLALANKESLVIGGRLVTEAAAPGQIVPVDSEHSALAQCLRGGRAEEVERLVVTASGGPFRGWSRARLADVTPEQAMAHPTWAMGRVITINSATLVNKALEVLEAHLLFDIDLERIEVVVHPQSIVHSMVGFIDGSTLAQVSPPDMALPIALGLTWPDRLRGASAPIDITRAAEWTFEPLDEEVFGAVALIRECGRRGGTAPAVFNAANEACVDAFCAGRLSFPGIVDTVARVVTEHVSARSSSCTPSLGSLWRPDADTDLDSVLAADAWARARADALTQSGVDDQAWSC